MSYQPLAERMRPKTLSEVVGQEHLIGPGKILSELLSRQRLSSLILWGPAGTGKTTLARIVASEYNARFVEISAVTSGKPEVKRIIEDAKVHKRLGEETVLFIDEIHRFSKSQQDAFLPHVEDGTITLIGATTENPSFEVIGPLLSRSRVLLLEPLTHEHLRKIVTNAMKTEKVTARRFPKESVEYLISLSLGDARVALGNLEMALQLTDGKITKEVIELAAQKRMPSFDKTGEQHYNVISAFIKSMRGSDPDAAVYYLARMLQAGEDPKFIARRMVVFASEDVGMAAPAALNLAVSTFLAVERVGMPECEHNLYHCAIVLAKTDKSRQVVEVMERAKQLARDYPNAQVPIHLRSKATRRMHDKSVTDKSKKINRTTYKDSFLPLEIEGQQIID